MPGVDIGISRALSDPCFAKASFSRKREKENAPRFRGRAIESQAL